LIEVVAASDGVSVSTSCPSHSDSLAGGFQYHCHVAAVHALSGSQTNSGAPPQGMKSIGGGHLQPALGPCRFCRPQDPHPLYTRKIRLQICVIHYILPISKKFYFDNKPYDEYARTSSGGQEGFNGTRSIRP